MNVVTGRNGSGKSSLYRALRLLAEASGGGLVSALAHEGGLSSTFWAGPEIISERMRRGEVAVEGTVRREPDALRLGFASEDFGATFELGYPSPTVGFPTAFVRDPTTAPMIRVARDDLQSFRFYDHLRTDPEAPARSGRVDTRTLVLAPDGRDLASAWQTVCESDPHDGLLRALDDAFPGALVERELEGGRTTIGLRQPGMVRTLGARELSHGTLRYLMLLAALFSPRPPPVLVLNEPETSLHPDLLPTLCRLLVAASVRRQVLVITHARILVDALRDVPDARHIELVKDLGETFVRGQRLVDRPPWVWPARSSRGRRATTRTGS